MVQGKPDSNIVRYVYTMIDKKPCYLLMSKCNHCPFLINDFENQEARCGQFTNPSSKYEHKDFLARVYGYIQKRYGTSEMNILTPVSIPSWCGLPNHIAQITPNDAISYIKDGRLQIDSGQNYANTVQVISDSEVKFSSENGESLVRKPKESKYIHYGTKPYGTPKKDTHTCSSCGKDKKDVNRNKHLGMCGYCWDKFKFSHPRRYNAKINNFRLKRKEDWTKETFKIVKT